MSKKIELRVTLKKDFIEKIERLKIHYGTKNTTELIRVLITDKYREILRED